jgi:hypothetical protein
MIPEGKMLQLINCTPLFKVAEVTERLWPLLLENLISALIPNGEQASPFITNRILKPVSSTKKKKKKKYNCSYRLFLPAVVFK